MKTWSEIINAELGKPYMKRVNEFLQSERKQKVIYPAHKDVFNAFRLTPFNKVKVVIIGQDPYHDGSAHGLAFSCLKSYRPPSLYNIYKEINEDTGLDIPSTNDLTFLAEQGVLLLNTSLTVEAGIAGSHAKIGWQTFTSKMISELYKDPNPKVFLLWGNHAQKMFDEATMSSSVKSEQHLILRAAHPSPLSANKGFFGCKHFSQTNEFLLERLSTFILWTNKEEGYKCNLYVDPIVNPEYEKKWLKQRQASMRSWK